MLISNFLLYIASFVMIWIGAGLIVTAMDKFSKRLKVSSFAVSFVVLGLLTSTTEFSVGLTSVAQGNPQVFVGNLLGGITVIFLLIIPLLAILGNGINLKHDLTKKTLLISIGVIALPSLLILDGTMNGIEAIALIIAYVIGVYFIQVNHGILDGKDTKVLDIKLYSHKDIIKMIIGIGVVLISGSIIVDKTLYFSDFLNISPFIISLVVLSIGTNLPELSLAIRSVLSGEKDVAFGDYLGSASANTLLFGIFTLLYGGPVREENSPLAVFLFIAGGLTLFYFFSRSKNIISRTEGFIMLSVYILFVIFEFF